MNFHQLQTFIKTADAGSFLKASETLYISSNAVAKQITSLERELGFKLFERTSSGVKSTKGGKLFYNDVKYIVNYMNGAVTRAKNAEQANQNIIRVGTTLTNPGNILIDIWPQIHALYPEIKFELHPFENSEDSAPNILANLGKDIDVIVGIFEANSVEKNLLCNNIELFREELCIGVSVSHPLAEKKQLEVSDLDGMEVTMLKKGVFSAMDAARNLLLQQSKAMIQDLDFYDMNIFNRCSNGNEVLVMIPEWQNIHPLVKTISVSWDFTLPFGILYGKNPSLPVKKMLCAMAQIYTGAKLI